MLGLNLEIKILLILINNIMQKERIIAIHLTESKYEILKDLIFKSNLDLKFLAEISNKTKEEVEADNDWFFKLN
tara:strand:+ start:4547 stop:4768 length:222 start_codon:yes stop_codon:yes gene_type:complete